MITPHLPLKHHFSHIDTWVFDLDNTLYPPYQDLWPRIDARIGLYISQLLGLDGLSGRALQKYYYQKYGTTLHGLMADHNICAHDFLNFVHDIDRSCLDVDTLLVEGIAALPGRKLILTNGSKAHADATLQQLGLDHLFEDVFGIIEAQFAPKPEPLIYERFFETYKIDPTRAAMFEDLAHNLRVPHGRGMKTILIVPKEEHTDHRDAWEKGTIEDTHIDFMTDDLAAFLKGIY